MARLVLHWMQNSEPGGEYYDELVDYLPKRIKKKMEVTSWLNLMADIVKERKYLVHFVFLYGLGSPNFTGQRDFFLTSENMRITVS